MQFNYREAQVLTATYKNHRERRQKLMAALKENLEMHDAAEYDSSTKGHYFIRGMVPDSGSLSAQLAQHDEATKSWFHVPFINLLHVISP